MASGAYNLQVSRDGLQIMPSEVRSKPRAPTSPILLLWHNTPGASWMKKYVLSRKAERRGRRRQWRQTFAAVLRAALIEPHQVEITHQRIAIEKLPAEFRGLRIVQLSDVHHSPFLDEERINEAVRMANDLQPDLVALTGDYISHSRDYIPGCARALGKLRAAHGVFAVLGNHDHWTDGAMMREALVRQGVRVLCNESARIEKGFSYINLAGVDDMLVKRDDLRKALEG